MGVGNKQPTTTQGVVPENRIGRSLLTQVNLLLLAGSAMRATVVRTPTHDHCTTLFRIEGKLSFSSGVRQEE